jgi:hypothetical protein
MNLLLQKVNLTQPTVNRDLAYLRQEDQDNLQEHIPEAVLEEQQSVWLV